jgi:hypothetical protein
MYVLFAKLSQVITISEPKGISICYQPWTSLNDNRNDRTRERHNIHQHRNDCDTFM